MLSGCTVSAENGLVVDAEGGGCGCGATVAHSTDSD